MTLNEAKAVIYGNVVYACEKAGCPPYVVQLVQDACDTVIALADKTEPQNLRKITQDLRKTESNSEIPNNCIDCDTCRFEDCKPSEAPCAYCMVEDLMWKPKDEPQTERSE